MTRAALVLLCLIAIVLIAGCGDEDQHTSILPTVPAPPSALGNRFVTCHDWNGVRPDKDVQVPRADRHPRYCFVGDICFYNCPDGFGD